MGLLLGVIELPSFHFLATKTKMLILCPQFAFRPILDLVMAEPCCQGTCHWVFYWRPVFLGITLGRTE